MLPLAHLYPGLFRCFFLPPGQLAGVAQLPLPQLPVQIVSQIAVFGAPSVLAHFSRRRCHSCFLL